VKVDGLVTELTLTLPLAPAWHKRLSIIISGLPVQVEQPQVEQPSNNREEVVRLHHVEAAPSGATVQAARPLDEWSGWQPTVPHDTPQDYC